MNDINSCSFQIWSRAQNVCENFIKHKKSLCTTVVVHTFDYTTHCRVMIGFWLQPPPFPPTQVMISSCTQDKINVEIYEELKINSTDVFAIYALSNVKYENEIWNYLYILSTLPTLPPPPPNPPSNQASLHIYTSTCTLSFLYRISIIFIRNDFLTKERFLRF